MAIIITETDIRKAQFYVPLAIKETLSRIIGHLCIEPVANPKSTELQPLPNYYRENRKLRQQFMMGILAHCYLGKEYRRAEIGGFTSPDGGKMTKQLDFCMDTDDYDEWAGSHAVNQLERLKKSKDRYAADNKSYTIGDAVYDLLYDYKGFEKMILGAIQDELAMLNDPCDRISSMINIQSSPEVMDAAKAEIAKMFDSIKEMA